MAMMAMVVTMMTMMVTQGCRCRPAAHQGRHYSPTLPPHPLFLFIWPSHRHLHGCHHHCCQFSKNWYPHQMCWTYWYDQERICEKVWWREGSLTTIRLLCKKWALDESNRTRLVKTQDEWPAQVWLVSNWLAKRLEQTRNHRSRYHFPFAIGLGQRLDIKYDEIINNK